MRIHTLSQTNHLNMLLIISTNHPHSHQITKGERRYMSRMDTLLRAWVFGDSVNSVSNALTWG